MEKDKLCNNINYQYLYLLRIHEGGEQWMI